MQIVGSRLIVMFQHLIITEYSNTCPALGASFMVGCTMGSFHGIINCLFNRPRNAIYSKHRVKVLKARKEAFQTQKALQIGQSKNETGYYIGENIVPENAAEFGETFFTIVKNKDGKYTIPYFTGMILPYINSWFQFALPADVTITILEDAKYVYIGTFEYDLDYALRVIGFNHYDEYSTAQKELNEALGYNATLYRAELNFN